MKTKLPFFLTPVLAGFPSPADDFIDKNLDLHEFLVKKPASTFLLRVKGDSMVGKSINDGDILIVDKSVKPYDGAIVIASVDDNFTVKTFYKKNNTIKLLPANENYPEIEINKGEELNIFGVVEHVIHSFK